MVCEHRQGQSVECMEDAVRSEHLPGENNNDITKIVCACLCVCECVSTHRGMAMCVRVPARVSRERDRERSW